MNNIKLLVSRESWDFLGNFRDYEKLQTKRSPSSLFKQKQTEFANFIIKVKILKKENHYD